MAIRLAGQVFNSMMSLVTFAGDKAFWELLDEQARSYYANLCRRNPSEKLFLLEVWMENPEIRAAVQEFKDELASEMSDPSNVNMDY